MESTVFAGKTLLITGGTGSFGNTVLKHFLSTDIGEIRIFSRDEKKQDDMRHDYQLKYPELSDKQSAQEIISAFEEKQQLAELVTQTLASDENKGIQVYIGSETPVQTMKDCSVVTATYELGQGMQGTVGIIGPKRMDYENVMKTLKTLMVELDAIFHKKS